MAIPFSWTCPDELAMQVIGYIIVGIMLLFTTQALAEMAVLFPVNGAFYTYVCRFVDPSW
jgi:yeast amino acid transporter